MMWYRPSRHVEHGELVRVSQDFNIPLADLVNKFYEGSLQALSNDIWEQLENTDSNDVTSLEDVLKYAHMVNRDAYRIIRGLERKEELPAPAILHYNSTYHLVAGNTRLMVCRAKKITPMVWIF